MGRCRVVVDPSNETKQLMREFDRAQATMHRAVANHDTLRSQVIYQMRLDGCTFKTIAEATGLSIAAVYAVFRAAQEQAVVA